MAVFDQVPRHRTPQPPVGVLPAQADAVQTLQAAEELREHGAEGRGGRHASRITNIYERIISIIPARSGYNAGMPPDPKPNIILLFPDQWRGDCLSSCGHPDLHTPWLDGLAAQGIRYSRAFSPSPICIPARYALLTGMSPWANGRLGYRDGVDWRPPHSLPGLLRDSGYQTMQVGKTHFHPMRAHLGFEINDQYEASVREAGYLSDYHAELARALPGVEDAALRRDPNAWTVDPWCAAREWHCSEWITTRAIQRLERRDPQRPFFLQIGWHRPHPPFDPPWDLWQRWRDRPVSEPVVGDWVPAERSSVHALGLDSRIATEQNRQARRAYYACIEHVDEQIGRVLCSLRRLGLERSTWVVFASDHGEFLGDHHARHKGQPNAASARIPLIVRAPLGHDTPRGALDDRPVSLSDLMPSFLRWSGASIPDACDAVALDGPARDWVHAELHREHSGWHALYDRRWAYHWHSDGSEHLFDHSNDPDETHELGAEDPQRLARWRRVLIEHLAGRGCGTSDGSDLHTGIALGPVRGQNAKSRKSTKRAASAAAT